MTSMCVKRLQRELRDIRKDPSSNITTLPEESNILNWHYVLSNFPADSPYHGGYYWGILKFPADFPFKPPSILMFTSSGRFKTNVRLCLSMSDYHPESWNPMWSISTILQGLLSFFLSDDTTLGSIQCSVAVRKQFARVSMKENMANPTFRKLFPELVESYEKSVAMAATPTALPSPSSSSEVKSSDSEPSKSADQPNNEIVPPPAPAPPEPREERRGKWVLVGWVLAALLGAGAAFAYQVHQHYNAQAGEGATSGAGLAGPHHHV